MRMNADGRVHERILLGQLDPAVEIRRPIAVPYGDDGLHAGFPGPSNHLLAVVPVALAFQMSVRIDEHSRWSLTVPAKTPGCWPNTRWGRLLAVA